MPPPDRYRPPPTKLANGEDISMVSDRALIVRGVDMGLSHADAIGRLASELSRVIKRVSSVEEALAEHSDRISALEQHRRRGREPSLHDIATEQIGAGYRNLQEWLEEPTNPGIDSHGRTPSERVRSQVREELSRLQTEKDAAETRARNAEEIQRIKDRQKERRTLLFGVAGAVCAAGIVALAGALWSSCQREAALMVRLNEEQHRATTTAPAPAMNAAPAAPPATTEPPVAAPATMRHHP